MTADPRRLAIFAAVTTVVVASSLVPAPVAADGEPRPDVAPPGTDLLLHVVGYAAVAYTLAGAAFGGRSDGGVDGDDGGGHPGAAPVAGLAGVVLVATALGAGVELAQGPVPGREPSVLDGAANAVGAAVGAAWWRRRGGERATE
ncbi:hypothetical protein [Halobaculum sp. EA56]|uniref:hypothetical protein n=1 Tax=Halobaculum sp. EA56 TaxID=3421648 RepID=UPI003EB6B892